MRTLDERKGVLCIMSKSPLLPQGTFGEHSPGLDRFEEGYGPIDGANDEQSQVASQECLSGELVISSEYSCYQGVSPGHENDRDHPRSSDIALDMSDPCAYNRNK
jgi:hypothetical protein